MLAHRHTHTHTHAHCSDFDNLNAAILVKIREHRKQSNDGDTNKKDSMKGAEDKLVQVGKKARNEVCVCVCGRCGVSQWELVDTLKVFVCMCGVWGVEV